MTTVFVLTGAAGGMGFACANAIGATVDVSGFLLHDKKSHGRKRELQQTPSAVQLENNYY